MPSLFDYLDVLVLLSQKSSIAVIGSGITGLSCAWLLAQKHNVTLFEKAPRAGGHSNTIDIDFGSTTRPVDTGFIVYNENTYPNLIALFNHLNVATQASDMSFAVSLDQGNLEYAGNNLATLFAQKRNLLRPRFWAMMSDLIRFYRTAHEECECLADDITLGDYLEMGGYSAAFRDDHLLPMASAIWSATTDALLNYPAKSFVRFNANHGLMQLTNRPIWRTVTGGSRSYVNALIKDAKFDLKLNTAITQITRHPNHVELIDAQGHHFTCDHVVLASHTDQSLAMLSDADAHERALLSSISYGRNDAWVHSDERFMPQRRKVWSSWNYLGERAARAQTTRVTYWMNLLQDLPREKNVFVTLNPDVEPDAAHVLHKEIYHHPIFTPAAMRAQKDIWSLQGHNRTWYCGAWMGAGFHEDGLQAGLALAEILGQISRPWRVNGPSARLTFPDDFNPSQLVERL